MIWNLVFAVTVLLHVRMLMCDFVILFVIR